MMDSAPRQARRRLRALLDDFDRVLGDEYEALKQRDSARLDRTTEAKQRLISEIDGATRDAGSPHSADDPEARDEWEQIKVLLHRCALANRTNGAAIDASRSFVNSLLDLLCGRTDAERVYQPDGRLGGARHGRALERV